MLHFKGKPTGAVVALRQGGYDVRLDKDGVDWPASSAVLVPYPGYPGDHDSDDNSITLDQTREDAMLPPAKRHRS